MLLPLSGMLCSCPLMARIHCRPHAYVLLLVLLFVSLLVLLLVLQVRAAQPS